ncbi:MAG TPA: hypothetical protein VFD58_13600 [Blastocatellia bacterium]|nr:hypothetical protein [Blastocatellia bacterium]
MRYHQHQDSIIHGVSIPGLILALAGTLVMFGFTHSALATGSGEKAAKKTGDKNGESASESSATRRDPFIVPSRVKHTEKPRSSVKEPQPITPPGLDMRLSDFRSQVRQASMTGQTAPDKTAAFTMGELKINGIFKNSDGYGAFVSEDVSGKKMTFFVRAGMRTYDGVIKEITPTGVRFVKNTRYDNGSVRQTEEFRPLEGKK